MKSVCVFCGSSLGANPDYANAAEAFGGLLAARGLKLVYGGGKIGLMGRVADAALAGGGEVVGVIPGFLRVREVEHRGLSELFEVESMHARKTLMAELSDAFVVLPGGFGTLDEMCEILTWAQLGLHAKPVGLLNVAGYYDALLSFFDRAAAQRFITVNDRDRLLVDTDAEALLAKLYNARPR